MTSLETFLVCYKKKDTSTPRCDIIDTKRLVHLLQRFSDVQ